MFEALSMLRLRLLRAGRVAMLLTFLAAAQKSPGAVAIYTNETDFLTAISGLPTILNDFTNFGYTGWLGHDIQVSSNGISYYITSDPPLDIVAFQGGVSTIDVADTIVPLFTSSNVTGAGGYIYAVSDENGTLATGSLTVSLPGGVTTNVSSVQGAPPPFLGFLSDGPLLTSLNITNTSGNYPALSHFYVAGGIPVPTILLTGANTMMLSWPAWATGFSVYACSRLSDDTWTNLNLTPQKVGNQFQVFVPVTGPAGFFRLAR
jgi:hypothetical protein